jgi:hypothetical protein
MFDRHSKDKIVFYVVNIFRYLQDVADQFELNLLDARFCESLPSIVNCSLINKFNFLFANH